MDNKLTNLKDEFLLVLYELSKIKMVGYIAGFTMGEDALMLRLFLNEKMTPKELSESLQITKGRVTAIINTLKKKNYVLTTTNENDKRSFIIELSKTGHSYFKNKLDIADSYFANTFALLGLGDAKSLVWQMKKILKKVKEDKL